ncbi:MAG: hypothetical protein PVI00_15685 [Desulfobacterales bacterium]|jgi:hypothetical protein
MDKRINRFKICDFRFYPYLAAVFERLPEAARDKILSDESFQILTDEDIFNAYMLRYDFANPVKALVYLNSKILTKSRHQIIYIIAHEVAKYVLSVTEAKAGFCEKDIEDLLMDWGFEKEAEAVRNDKTITESEAYKIGNEWARKQSHDYLMQHFGLYFDEWNGSGLGSKVLNKLNQHAETDLILDTIIQLKKEKELDHSKDRTLQTPSLRKAMLAGIMVAIKEFELKYTTTY